MSELVWSVELTFSEDDEKTRADAYLTVGDRRFHGWGRAKRNPVDPDVPMIGEEVAASRALADLSHELLRAAADEIERFAGGPVTLHT